MEIDITEEKDRNGHILEFTEGDTISTCIFLDKKSRYKLMQILIEKQLKEV